MVFYHHKQKFDDRKQSSPVILILSYHIENANLIQSWLWVVVDKYDRINPEIPNTHGPTASANSSP